MRGETEARSGQQSQGRGSRHPRRLPTGNSSSLTHGAGAGSVRAVQFSPQHRPCKAIGNTGSPSARHRGEHPSRGGGRGGGRKGEENERCCLPREKTLGKMSSIPGDQVGKHYPGGSVSFGKEPGGAGARSKRARLGKHCGYFLPSPALGGHGAGAAGEESPGSKA